MSAPFYKDPMTLVTGGLIAVVLIVVSLFYFNKQQPIEPVAVVPEQPVYPIERNLPTAQPEQAASVTDSTASAPVEQPSAPVKATPVKPLPSLAASDEPFVQDAQSLTPSFLVWLTPKQQIRRWVALVNVVAHSNVPVNELPLDYPMAKFQVDERGEQLFFNLKNVQRAQPLIDAVTAIPPEQLVKFYHYWQPLFEEAYSEFGNNDTFAEVLNQAIDNILAVSVISQPQELKQPAVFYTYADPQLEKSDKLHKFIWRLGADNAKRIHTYLTQVKALL